MMVASLANIKLEEVVLDATAASQLLTKIGGGATLPVLESEEGPLISQTTAILQYLAWGTDLLGKSAFEKA